MCMASKARFEFAPVDDRRATAAEVVQNFQQLDADARDLRLVCAPPLLHELRQGTPLRQLLSTDTSRSTISVSALPSCTKEEKGESP